MNCMLLVPQARSSRCRFVKCIDDEWPAKFQEVARTLWDVVDQYKKKADEAKADFMGAIALRNQEYEEKEALLREKDALLTKKEDWIKE